MPTTITLNGRTIDLAPALPLTIGDWKALKKRAGITPQTLQRQDKDIDPEVIAAYVFWILHKADPQVTEQDVDHLTFGQIAQIMKVVGALAGEDDAGVDRPFSASSTPSPASTAGANANFSN